MITIKRSLQAARMCAAALLLSGVSASQAAAQTPDPTATTLNFFKNTEIGGLVDGSYDYYSTKQDGVYRNFDTKHNVFTVNMAEVWVTKTPAADSRVGYRVRLNYGPAASNYIAFAEPTTPLVNVEEAYGSYLAGVGKGLQIDFGKFVTNAGAEVIEAKDNWNYSRSLLFALAIPYYHAGLKVSYPASDKVSIMAGVVNGWNVATGDNNSGKTGIFGLTIKPTGSFTFIENYIVGPEQAGTTDNVRHLSDTILSYTINPKASVMLNYDYGKEGSASWQGVAAYLKYQASPIFAVVPRYEYYDDGDGFSTGTVQTLQDFTLTFEVKGGDNFLWRIEYRGDFSDRAVFTTDSGATKKNQQSIAFGFLFSFSTKS